MKSSPATGISALFPGPAWGFLIDPTPGEIDILDRFEQVPRVMVKDRIEVLIGDLNRDANIYLKA